MFFTEIPIISNLKRIWTKSKLKSPVHCALCQEFGQWFREFAKLYRQTGTQKKQDKL